MKNELLFSLAMMILSADGLLAVGTPAKPKLALT